MSSIPSHSNALWHKLRKQTCFGKLGVVVGMLSIGGVVSVALPVGVAAGGSVAVSGVGVGIAAAVGNILGGMGVELLSSRLERWFPENSLHPSEKLNHDVELVVGHAMEGVMRELIQNGSPHAEIYRRLLKREFSEAWQRLMIEHDPSTTLDLPEPQALLVAAADLRVGGSRAQFPPCLDEATWKAWLRCFDSRSEFQVTPACLDELVPTLTSRLYWHIVDALKTDFDKGGKAYVAIQLHTAASTLALVRQQSRKLAELGLKPDRIENYVIHKACTVAAAGGLTDEQFELFQAEFAALHVKLDSLLRLTEQMLQAQEAQKLLAMTNGQLASAASKLSMAAGQLLWLSEQHWFTAVSTVTERDRIYAELVDAERRADAGDTDVRSALAQAQASRSFEPLLALQEHAHNKMLDEVSSNRVSQTLEHELLVGGCIRLVDRRIAQCVYDDPQARLKRTLSITGDRLDLLVRLAHTHLRLLQLDEAILVLRRAEKLVDQDRDRSMVISEMGVLQYLQGDHTSALESFRKSQTIFQQIVDIAGESPQALRDLSFSLNRVAEVQNGLKEASDSVLEFHRRALDIRQQVVDELGETRQTLCELAYSLDMVALSQFALSGASDVVLDCHRKALNIRQRIVDTFGESDGSLRDVSNSLVLVADAEQSLNGPSSLVLEGYSGSLACLQQSIDRFGETAMSLDNMASCLCRFANAEQALNGPSDVVLECYRKALAFQQRRVDRFGESERLLMDQCDALIGVSDAESALNDISESVLDGYRKSLSTSQRLTERFGESAASLQYVAVSLHRIAGAERNLTGPSASVLETYRQSLAITQKIIGRFGGSPETLQDCAFAMQTIGFLQVELGERETGIAQMRNALKLLEEIAQVYGMTPQRQHDIDEIRGSIVGFDPRQ